MPAPPLQAILFDVGNVLIQWDPRHLYRKILVTADGHADETQIDRFLETICTAAWNAEQDRG